MSESYWWCPGCKEEAPSSRVTYDELHEDCGHPVVLVEPGDPIATLRASLAKAEAERDAAVARAEAAEKACRVRDRDLELQHADLRRCDDARESYRNSFLGYRATVDRQRRWLLRCGRMIRGLRAEVDCGTRACAKAERERDTAEAQAAAMRGALEAADEGLEGWDTDGYRPSPLAKKIRAALSLDAGRELAEEVRDLRARIDTGICSWGAEEGDKAHGCPHVKDATARAEKAGRELAEEVGRLRSKCETCTEYITQGALQHDLDAATARAEKAESALQNATEQLYQEGMVIRGMTARAEKAEVERRGGTIVCVKCGASLSHSGPVLMSVEDAMRRAEKAEDDAHRLSRCLDEAEDERGAMVECIEEHLPLYAYDNGDESEPSVYERVEYAADELRRVTARAEKAERDLAEHEASADLRHASDMRAIERWRAAHPDQPLTWPDHADLVVWLVEQSERDLAAERAETAAWRAKASDKGECARRLRAELEAEKERGQKLVRYIERAPRWIRGRAGPLHVPAYRCACDEIATGIEADWIKLQRGEPLGDPVMAALRAPDQEPREDLHGLIERATAGGCACTDGSPCAAHALDPTLPEPCWACGKRRERCACQPSCPSCGHPATEHDGEGCNHDLGLRRYANGNTTGEHGFCVCDKSASCAQSGQADTQDGEPVAVEEVDVPACPVCGGIMGWPIGIDHEERMICLDHPRHTTCACVGDSKCMFHDIIAPVLAQPQPATPTVPGCVCGHPREMHAWATFRHVCRAPACECFVYQPAPAPGTREEEQER